MPITLRMRPVCHYCGKRNNPINNRRFQCQHCLAENFLDENGEVADVPSEIVSTPKQYASSVESPSIGDHSIFCTTCLKNQAMYTAALSEFLPDPDDEDYERFEIALPEFKKRMDIQFPQCCAQCEPRVRAQLEQASYNARTDHLRRVLEKTRAKRLASRLGWRSILVAIGGLCFFSSILIQLAWHALGSQSAGGVMLTQPLDCITTWPISVSCANIVERYMWMSYVTGLLSIWWNPKWQAKLQGRADRLKGLSKYYKAQIASLTLRFVAWIMIKDIPAVRPHHKELHSLFLVLIALVAGSATFNIISVDDTPLVNWQQDPAPLITSGQFEPPNPVSPPSSQGQSFSIGNLGSDSVQHFEAWRPPTPPIDADAMDWAPSTNSFTPNPKQVKYKSTEATPFHGALPQLPQGNIFASRSQRTEQQKPIGIPMGFFDRPPASMQKQESEERALLAQPKFFPDNERADTGLENIFGKVFSLNDEAPEVRKPLQSKSAKPALFDRITTPAHPEQELSLPKVFNAVAITVLFLFTTCILLLNYLGSTSSRQTEVILMSSAAIPAVKVIISLLVKRDNLRIPLYLFESSGILGLLSSTPDSQSLLLPLWNKLIIGAISIMLCQEVYDFCTDDQVERRHETSSDSMTPTALPMQAEAAPQQVSAMEIPPSSLQARRDSMSSVASNSSINTTSTASGWKTPTRNHRMELAESALRSRRPSSNAFGIGSLGLDDFTVGNSVAGPRTRGTSNRQAR